LATRPSDSLVSPHTQPHALTHRTTLMGGAEEQVPFRADLLLDSLRRSSVQMGTIQRRLAWPLRKDDTHESRSVSIVCPFFLQSLCCHSPRSRNMPCQAFCKALIPKTKQRVNLRHHLGGRTPFGEEAPWPHYNADEARPSALSPAPSPCLIIWCMAFAADFR